MLVSIKIEFGLLPLTRNKIDRMYQVNQQTTTISFTFVALLTKAATVSVGENNVSMLHLK